MFKFVWLLFGVLWMSVRAQKCSNGNFYSTKKGTCIPCPRGRFGSLGTCVSCPRGRFNSALGIESVLDCELCEPGRFQPNTGGITCEGTCPEGTYSTKWGSVGVEECKTCPRGLASYMCGFDTASVQKVVPDDEVRLANRFPSSAFGRVESKPRPNTPPKKCGGMNNVCLTRHIQ
jgi:hypothetical protein